MKYYIYKKKDSTSRDIGKGNIYACKLPVVLICDCYCSSTYG